MDDNEPEAVTYAPAADWKAQRDSARAQAARAVTGMLAEIAKREADIDHQLTVMRDLECTYEQIAAATGLTPSVVQARCRRAAEG